MLREERVETARVRGRLEEGGLRRGGERIGRVPGLRGGEEVGSYADSWEKSVRESRVEGGGFLFLFSFLFLFLGVEERRGRERGRGEEEGESSGDESSGDERAEGGGVRVALEDALEALALDALEEARRREVDLVVGKSSEPAGRLVELQFLPENAPATAGAATAEGGRFVNVREGGEGGEGEGSEPAEVEPPSSESLSSSPAPNSSNPPSSFLVLSLSPSLSPPSLPPSPPSSSLLPPLPSLLHSTLSLIS